MECLYKQRSFSSKSLRWIDTRFDVFRKLPKVLAKPIYPKSPIIKTIDKYSFNIFCGFLSSVVAAAGFPNYSDYQKSLGIQNTPLKSESAVWTESTALTPPNQEMHIWDFIKPTAPHLILCYGKQDGAHVCTSTAPRIPTSFWGFPLTAETVSHEKKQNIRRVEQAPIKNQKDLEVLQRILQDELDKRLGERYSIINNTSRNVPTEVLIEYRKYLDSLPKPSNQEN